LTAQPLSRRGGVRRACSGALGALTVVALAGAAWFVSPRSFVAEDSYFYLVAARRIALDGHHSFSGVFASNGFHPLWLYLLAGWSWVVGLIDADLLWRTAHAVPLSLALLATAAVSFHAVERRLGLGPGTLAIPPVVFTSVLGVLYSEAHALLAALGWLASLVVRLDRTAEVASWKLGLAAAAVALARLDAVFLSVWVLIWAAARGRRTSGTLHAFVVFTALVGGYVAANVWFFGGPVPISGWLKSSAPVPTLSGFEGSGLGLSLSDYSVAFGVLPVALGVAACIILGVRGRLHALLALFTAGSVAHMAYTMLFASYCGWNWYYVLPVVNGTLASAMLLGEAAGPPARFAAIAAWTTVIAGAAGIAYKVSHDDRTESMRLIQTHLSSPQLAGKTVFVSELPGAGAFLGRANVVAADMLTANKRLYDRVLASADPWQEIVDYCRARGRPIEQVVYIGGSFVEWDGADGLIWLDPKVSSRRPLAPISTGGRLAWRPDVPFAIWRTPPAPGGPISRAAADRVAGAPPR
jgi:hypothetical protein